MPSSTSFPLSISEILEAQKGPFKELEIWALLCQCAEALQDIIMKGDIVSTGGFRYMLSPNNLMIRDNGTIVFTEGTESICGTLYSAPEVESGASQTPLSDTGFEKIFVFSLGRTLQVASEFGLRENEILGISYDLDSLLQAMTKRNATLRIGLMHILEACSMEASQNPQQPPHSVTLARLYKTVVSSSGKPSYDSSYGSDYSHKHSSKTGGVRQGRLRRPRQQLRHRKTDRHSSESPPTSKSRSRSRSRSRRNYEGPDDLSHGRDVGGIFDTSAFSDIASSADLNSSMISTASEQSDLPPRQTTRNLQVPPYSASHSVQGLLGLRQGSPAYQKYILLKERQMRLRQARSGQGSSALNDVRSRLMTPTLQSHDAMDRMSDTRSMASLISFTLGTYRPDLHENFGSEAAINYNSATDVDSYFDSQTSLAPSSDTSKNVMRAQKDDVSKEFYVKKATTQQEFQASTQTQPQQKRKKEKQNETKDKSEKQPVLIQSVVEQKMPKQREYYGPEFVHKSRKPAFKIVIPFQDTSKGPSHIRHLTVAHLTGQKFEVALDPSTTARQLMDTIISHTDLDDFFFFGLTYMCEGEHFFLDADTKVHKVAPDGWKEGPKGHPPVTFTLYVRVKFYPDSLSDFRHTSSYHLLYLQLRKDIIEERTVCPTDILTKLAGLAMQVEYGDHNSATMGQNYFQAEQYFPARSVRRLGSSYVYSAAVQQHKACAGIASSQAEIEFIKHSKNLPEYGIHFHKLFKSKSQANGIVWVGLSQHHLVLAEADGHSRVIRQDYLWNALMKISFNKRRFSIQPKVEVAKGKPPKINFYTNSHRKGRYLLQFSTDQHRFQIRMRTRPSNMETLTGDLGVEIAIPPQTTEIGVGDDVILQDEMMMVPALVEPSQQPLPIDEDDEDDFEDEKESISLPSTTAEHAPLKYTRVSIHFYPSNPLPPYISPPPYQPPSMLPFIDDTTSMFPEMPGMSEFSLDASIVQAQASNPNLERPYLSENVLDISSRSISLDSALPSDKTGAEVPSQMDSNSLYFPSSENQVGRRIFKVVLIKDSYQGIGITIVGGETTNSLDLGIFVKSVVPGGPAALSGRIKPGDRLIAIGGTSLEGKQHHEAVALIRDAGLEVELLISQIKPPGTLRRQNYDHNFEQIEFEKKLRNSMIDRNLDENDSFLETETNDSIDYSTAAKDAVAMRFLQFDDMINDNDKADTLNDSNSFQAYNSEAEGRFDLESSHSTPPPPPLPSRPPPDLFLDNDDNNVDNLEESLNEREWMQVSEKMEKIRNENETDSRQMLENIPADYESRSSMPMNSNYLDLQIQKSQKGYDLPGYNNMNAGDNAPTRKWSEGNIDVNISQPHVLEGLEVPISPMSQISNEFPATSLSEIEGKTVVSQNRNQQVLLRENPVASFSNLQEESIVNGSSRNIPETSITHATERMISPEVDHARMMSPVASFSHERQEEEAAIKPQNVLSRDIPEIKVRNADSYDSYGAPLDRAELNSPVSSFSQVMEENLAMTPSPVSKEIPVTSFGQAQEKLPESYDYVTEGSPVAFFRIGHEEDDSLLSNSSVHEEVSYTSYPQVREEIPASESVGNPNVIGMEANAGTSAGNRVKNSVLNSSDDVFDSGRGSNDEDLEDVLKKLRADNELALELELAGTDDRLVGEEDEWSNDDGLGVSADFYHDGLTAEEKGDLQILGDIAALEAEASSSDSDFDTAIKNTVDGSRRKKLTRKAVHPVSPMIALEVSEVFPLEAGSKMDEISYEIILERKNKNDSFGIVTETITSNESPNGALYIKDLTPNSPAEQGSILKPGDKMLEINGQRVTGLSAAQAHAVLDSPLDFCTVKVSRSARADGDGVLGDSTNRIVGLGQATSHLSESPPLPTPPPAYYPMMNDTDTVPIASLIPSGPTEKTQPLDDDRINIVPPPPPIKFGQEESESNNTQSDVDSDVLDQSSRSDLESMYKNAEHFLYDNPGLTPRVNDDDEKDDDLSALEELNKVIRSQATLELRPSGKPVTALFEDDDSDYTDTFPSQILENRNRNEDIQKNISVSDSDHSSSNNEEMSKRIEYSNDSSILEKKEKLEENDAIKSETTLSEIERESLFDEEGEGKKLISDHKRPVPSGGGLPGGVPQESSSCTSNPEPDYSLSESEPEKSVMENVDEARRRERQSNESYDPEIIEVTLSRKDGGGFGFTVAGGINTGGCYIKQLLAAPASQSGTLLPGDKILMVNNQDTTKLSHMEAVSMLRKGPNEVTLKLLRYPPGIESQERLMMLKKLAGRNQEDQHEEPERTLSHDPSLPLRSFRKEGDYVTSLPSGAPKAVIRPFDNQTQQPRENVLENPDIMYRPVRDIDDDLFQLGGGGGGGGGEDEREKEVEEDVIVKEERDVKVFQGFKSSRLFDDRIEDDDAGDYDTTDDSARLDRDADGDSQPMTGLIRIELVKQPGAGLGMRINSTNDNGDGPSSVYVKKLQPGGVADRDGRLRPGDRLLQANGISLVGLDSKEAVAILTDAKDKVVLTITRPESDKDLSYEDLKPDYDDDDDIESLVEDAISTLSNDDKSVEVEVNSPEVEVIEESTEPEPEPVMELIRKSAKPILERNFSVLEGTDVNREDGTWRCPRILDIDVPVTMTDDWLSTLPLMKIPVTAEGEEIDTTDILQSLVDIVESGEPMEEFKTLRQLKEAESCEAGKLPQNKMKNRYRNILPYDSNRVKIEHKPNDEDYINASYISIPIGSEENGSVPILEYIACQGPLEATMHDMWAMVWQEDASVIVSLTKTVDGVKCHKFWPQNEGQVLQLDGRLVNCLQTYSLEDFDVYHLLQEDCQTGVCKKVILLHHTSWPDHGTPDTALPLLKILRVMHMYERGKRPVIHCSAGIGRTGAFIAIDVALATIENGEQFDLFQIVKNLRSQRHGFIQTTDQYLFCYTACMEALLSLEMQDE